eukprot:scaffold32920_cov129-Isochrysis_galbana.AAC.1
MIAFCALCFVVTNDACVVHAQCFYPVTRPANIGILVCVRCACGVWSANGVRLRLGGVRPPGARPERPVATPRATKGPSAEGRGAAALTARLPKNPMWFSHVARAHQWVAPLTNPHGRRWRLDARPCQAPISKTHNNNQVRPTPAAQRAP